MARATRGRSDLSVNIWIAAACTHYMCVCVEGMRDVSQLGEGKRSATGTAFRCTVQRNALPMILERIFVALCNENAIAGERATCERDARGRGDLMHWANTLVKNCLSTSTTARSGTLTGTAEIERAREMVR